LRWPLQDSRSLQKTTVVALVGSFPSHHRPVTFIGDWTRLYVPPATVQTTARDDPGPERTCTLRRSGRIPAHRLGGGHPPGRVARCSRGVVQVGAEDGCALTRAESAQAATSARVVECWHDCKCLPCSLCLAQPGAMPYLTSRLEKYI
jgi:hypothetical protein